MANFDEALNVVLRHEGGKANVPGDRGGQTNCGITQHMLESYLIQAKRPIYSVDQMNVDDIREFYMNVFWTPLHLSGINSDALATCVFDMAVLAGGPNVVQCLQVCAGVKPDGILGPESFEAINRQPADAFAMTFLLACQAHFTDIANRDSSQQKFLAGWINRTHDLMRLVT